MRITFVGHVCIDRNVIHGKTETFYGGGVIHGAVTAMRLGAEVTVLTKCAPEDHGGFTAFDGTGIHSIFLRSVATTSIRNFYPGDNPDDRRSCLLSRGDPFTPLDCEMIEADVVHLNPLWLGEFPLALLPALRHRAALVSGDAQGFLRQADEDGTMVNRDLADKHDILPVFDVFKVDAREAEILTGHDDCRRAAGAVQALGPKIVILTHRGGVCVYDGKQYYESPFTGFTIEGRTGRGDTCTAAFLCAMQRMSLLEATALAAEVTSKKMQYRGTYRG